MAGSLLSGLAGQGALGVSGVLAARLLGLTNRGNLALLLVIPIALSVIGGLGLPDAATYFVAAGAPGGTRMILRSLLRFATVQTLALVALHASLLVALYADRAADVQEAALYTLGLLPALMMLQYGLGILQGRHQFALFNIFRVLPVLLYSGAVVATFVLGLDDLALLAALWTGVFMVSGVLALALALKSLPAGKQSVAVPPLSEMLSFGLRGLLGSASPVEVFSLDQVAVGLLLSPAALGIYVTATAFTNLPRFLAQSIGMIEYPTVAASPDLEGMRSKVWRFLWFTVVVTVVTVLTLELLMGKLVVFLFGHGFAGAVPIARILLVAALLMSCRRVLADGVRGAGQPTLGSIGELVSWIFLVPLMVLLAPLLGLEGVAIAVVVSAAVSFVTVAAVWWVALREPRVEWISGRARVRES